MIRNENYLDELDKFFKDVEDRKKSLRLLIKFNNEIDFDVKNEIKLNKPKFKFKPKIRLR